MKIKIIYSNKIKTMKKILTLFALIVFSLNVISQVVTVDLNQFAVRELERVLNEETGEFENKFPKWDKPEDINMVMVYDLTKKVIWLDNERKSKFQTYEVAKTTTGVDEDGDDYVSIEFNCTDEVGVKCILELTIFEKIGIVQLYVMYSNVQVYYHGFIRELPKQTPLQTPEQRPLQHIRTIT